MPSENEMEQAARDLEQVGQPVTYEALRAKCGGSSPLQAAGSMQPPTGATPGLHAISRMLSQHLWVGQAFRPWLACRQNAHASTSPVVLGVGPVVIPRRGGKAAKAFRYRELRTECRQSLL
jgi:hypothetical protein